MESLKEGNERDVDAGDVTTKTRLDMPAHSKADSCSASQSTCEDQNPSKCGINAQLRCQERGQPWDSSKTAATSECPCDDLNIVNGNDGRTSSFRRRHLKSIWIPYTAVVLPTLVLPAVLIGLVFLYQVDTGTDLFPLSDTTSTPHQGYYLVAFSVTHLAIISSCASTLAPFLAAPILIIWRLHAIRSAKKSSGSLGNGRLEIASLPQLRKLLGLLDGAPDELLKYLLRPFAKLFPTGTRKEQKPAMSRPVHLAAFVAACCVFITVSTWIADTIFHSLSDSVNIETFDPSTGMALSFGYSQTQRCRDFNRSDNDCLPCTQDLSEDLSLLEYTTRANEIFRLGANVSEASQIQTVGAGLSILLPRADRVSNRTDYRARTLGVSATCKPITETCNLQKLDIHTYTMFNCSEIFRGVIGENPIQPTNQNFTIIDPDTPALNFKPSAYMQYGFYQDSKLSNPYNSVGWDVNVPGWAVSAGGATTSPCPSDDALPATAHMGVAGRFSVLSAKAGVDLSQDPSLFSTTIYSDFVFHCTLEAHEVEYIWASGTVRNHTAQPAQATLLNSYIGQLPYYTQSAGDDMTDDILQMALRPDSQSMADEWAKLFSVRILSVLGGYTDPTTNTEQQTRVGVLVARVHIGSMWFLVACSLGTALFVSWITFRGLYIVSQDPEVHADADVLSYDGQIKELLREKQALSASSKEFSSKEEQDDIVEAAAMPQDPDLSSAPVPPERSFTGHSSATTVVPTMAEL